VDTFEEEEAIDLNSVAKELVSLEMEIKETDKVLAGFCDELGIPKISLSGDNYF